MPLSRAIVWMDSREARVFRFSLEDVERQRIKSRRPFRRVHHRAGAIGAGHPHLDRGYFDDIAAALNGVREWVLTGPGIAKSEMARHVGQQLPDLQHILCGLETSDHPTDRELLDQARWAFGRHDRVRPDTAAARPT
jgi:stalled ribosome rescue protein Dom34